jgi:hypothetical protein
MAVLKAGGREAITHYRVEKTFGPQEKPLAARVACRLETGRTHQIRVHMASKATPCLGASRPTAPARRPRAPVRAAIARGGAEAPGACTPRCWASSTRSPARPCASRARSRATRPTWRPWKRTDFDKHGGYGYGGYGYGGYGYGGYGYGYGDGYGYGRRGGTSQSLALSLDVRGGGGRKSDTPEGCAPGFRDGDRYVEPVWVTEMRGDRSCAAATPERP